MQQACHEASEAEKKARNIAKIASEGGVGIVRLTSAFNEAKRTAERVKQIAEAMSARTIDDKTMSEEECTAIQKSKDHVTELCRLTEEHVMSIQNRIRQMDANRVVKEYLAIATKAANDANEALEAVKRFETASRVFIKDALSSTHHASAHIHDAETAIEKAKKATEYAASKEKAAKSAVNSICKLSLSPSAAAAAASAAKCLDRAEIYVAQSRQITESLMAALDSANEMVESKLDEENQARVIAPGLKVAKSDLKAAEAALNRGLISCDLAENAARLATGADKSSDAEKFAKIAEEEASNAESAAGETLRIYQRLKEYEDSLKHCKLSKFINEIVCQSDEMQRMSRTAATTSRTAAVAARAAADAPRPGGVGMKLRFREGEGHVIEELQKGMAAERSGKIMIGDTIESIDDDGVMYTPSVRDLMAGAAGSPVSLMLRRKAANGDSYCLNVILERTELSSAASLKAVVRPSKAAHHVTLPSLQHIISQIDAHLARATK